MRTWMRWLAPVDRSRTKSVALRNGKRLFIERLEDRAMMSAAPLDTPRPSGRSLPVISEFVDVSLASDLQAGTPNFSPVPVASPFPVAQTLVDDSVEDLAVSLGTLRLSGVSPDRFNARTAPVVFSISKAKFSLLPGDIMLMNNGREVLTSSNNVTATKVTFNNVLVEGRNDLDFKAYDQRGLPVYFHTTIWAGALGMKIEVVDENGAALKNRVAVTARLADDQSVMGMVNSSRGTALLTNVPDRTIFLSASSGDRYGFVGVTGAAGTVKLVLRKFQAATAPPPADTTSQTSIAPLPAGSVIFSRTIQTSGEGEVGLTTSFKTQPGTTAVRVRYRFITSEVPGGFFGTKYNDYFLVSFRSAKGAPIAESNSMNGLGLAAFDSSGATSMREQRLDVNPKGETIEFRGAVANVGDDLYDSLLEVSVEELSAQLTYKLAWDPQNGGLKVTWTAKADIANATPVKVYFGNGTGFSNIVSSALFEFTVPGGTKAGATQVVQVPGDVLKDAPAATTHLIVASNDADAQGITDVRVTFGASADSSVVSAHTIEVVKTALRAAGQSSATITSTLRRPEDQARAMFNNLVNQAHTLQQNIQSQLALYGAGGDQVINVFASMVQGLTTQQAIANQAAIRQAMTDRIVELAEQGVRVSKHCVTPEQYAATNIVDVGRGVFTTVSRGRFIAAADAQAGVSLIDEPQNNCIHLEVTQ